MCCYGTGNVRFQGLICWVLLHVLLQPFVLARTLMRFVGFDVLY